MRVAIEHGARRTARPSSRSSCGWTPTPARRVLVHWTLVPGSGGDMIAAVGYERTAQHRAAAEARREAARLQRRVEELEALVEDLGDHSRSMEGFAATAAHQLSEPLIVAESGTIMVAEELGDAASIPTCGRGSTRSAAARRARAR